MKHVESATVALPRRRLLAAAGATAASVMAPAWAQAPAGKPGAAAAARQWRLLVNEAVTGETNFFVLTNKYRPLADFVSEQLKGRYQVGVEPVVDIKRFVSLAQAQPQPELVFGKSVNQLAKLVRDNGYQPIVRRADPYKAAFIVAKDSPIKVLADAGKLKAKVIMPDEFAATTAVARAELRRQNVTQAKITHVKFQEVVAMEIKMGMAQVGVVNPTVAKKWAEEGGRVLGETQPVVNWSLLASPQVPAATVEKLRDALMAMNTQSQAALGQMGVKAWALAERKDYMDLLAYTKE